MSLLTEIEGGAVQYRAAKVQDIDLAKGELFVKAAPYGLDTDIGGGVTERFEPRTFARAAKEPSRLQVFHNHAGPLVGRGIEVDDRPEGIWIRAKIGRSQVARDMLTDVEDGILTDPSVEFRPVPGQMKVTREGSGFRVVHRRAHLIGFAMVPEGAYGPSAYVESVRDARREREVEAARLWFVEWRARAV
jgi:phage head maturation protease